MAEEARTHSPDAGPDDTTVPHLPTGWIAQWDPRYVAIITDLFPPNRTMPPKDSCAPRLNRVRSMGRIVPPLIAALLGGCGRGFVEELLRAGGEALARERFHDSPGYGHDNDEVYGGNAADWARVLKREAIVTV